MIKVMGALLIVLGCGGYGLMLSTAHKQEVKGLRQLRRALETMEAELEYRMTPLPELCLLGAEKATGQLKEALMILAWELDKQSTSRVQECMDTVLAKCKDLPPQCAAMLENLGSSLGRFDLEGQRKALTACREECTHRLEKLECDQTQRLRDYRTLSFCAGAALAILLF